MILAASRLTINWIMAIRIHASVVSGKASKSLLNRRERLSQPEVRSTIKRHCRTPKSLALPRSLYELGESQRMDAGSYFPGALTALGHTAEGISSIEDGIVEWRTRASKFTMPFLLALKAEALYQADRTSEALEAVEEAEGLVKRYEERWWSAELHRLHGVFLTALGAEETKIEASFCAAIRIASEQKSRSLAARAEGTIAEYRRQRASVSGGRGCRLPLC